jgi:hypothetical protein
MRDLQGLASPQRADKEHENDNEHDGDDNQRPNKVLKGLLLNKSAEVDVVVAEASQNRPVTLDGHAHSCWYWYRGGRNETKHELPAVHASLT